MSRASRLLDLIQILRRHRQPVSGASLATELGISLRTLYRDIDTLVAQGAPIAGEAGVGYVLRPGFVLPPLMFKDEEMEALVLGARLVASRADPALARAAMDALAKIVAVLPEDLRERAAGDGLLAVPPQNPPDAVDLGLLRAAVRAEQKVIIRYNDAEARPSERTIWPIAIAFFKNSRVLAAWCELRQDFRHFRTDRIASLSKTAARYPRPRRTLIKEWRAIINVPPPEDS